MPNLENSYQELHNLVRHGQKQGFAAGILFSCVVMSMRRSREARKTWFRAHWAANPPTQP